MVDGIIQKPDPISVGGTDYEKSSYTMFENGSNTDIQFFGTSDILSYDPNRAGLPLGGVIVSLGMTQGFGYQPLVSQVEHQLFLDWEPSLPSNHWKLWFWLSSWNSNLHQCRCSDL